MAEGLWEYVDEAVSMPHYQDGTTSVATNGAGNDFIKRNIERAAITSSLESLLVSMVSAKKDPKIIWKNIATHTSRSVLLLFKLY